MITKGLKILMVTTFYPPYSFGGDALYVAQLVRVLEDRGHEVDVLHNIDAHTVLSGRDNRCADSTRLKSNVHSLKSAFPFLSLLLTQQTGSPAVYRQHLEKIISDKQYDVIHYHNISLVGGPGVLKIGNAIKLYTAHEHWLVCPTHVLWRHNKEPCTKRECLKCVTIHKRPPQLWRYTGTLEDCSSHVDQFIALSEFSARKHREFGFAPVMHIMPSFIATSSNGVEVSDSVSDSGEPVPTASSSEGKKLAEPYFLFVGRLEFIKGLQEVIPLFRKGVGAKLVVAGTGAYEEELKLMAAGSPHIVFLGFLDPLSLGHWYQNSIAVILPSVCYEVFPLVVLEAFKHGIPVIARADGPFPEIIRKSRGGLLFENVQELNDGIGRLLNSDELCSTLSRAASKSFSSIWSEERAMQDYFRLIKRVALERDLRETREVLNNCSEDGYLLESAS